MNDNSEIVPDKAEFAPRPLPFPVIGIGASAGGLEAFERIIAAIDPEFSAAYVLVQHLDPNHESMLADLLARNASLPVRTISDGMEIESGVIYIIPSAAALTIEDGVLGLSEFDAPRGFRRPIDDFFASLAVDQGANAAAIVLSGIGGDGTVGIRHIKEAGGLAMVQEPSEAAYDGMPASAISTGLVDHVLPVGELPRAAARFFAAREAQPGREAFDREAFIEQVMEAVREQTGHDFSYYKINTVLRRVQRRMQVLDLVRPGDYVEALRDGPAEAEALFQDLLINVTAFFRDPEMFDLMRREVIPPIVAASGPDRPIRVWVPGCSSGEEAYSIAILIAEGLARAKAKPEVQIFATDIDEEMLARARAGTYMQSDVAELPPELLSRYFTANDDGFTVIPAIRDMVRVSAHSVIKDPPFSRLDLVSCRNLLIYFDARLQSRVLPLFHYALRPDGWLVLGSAENLAGRDDLFETHAREERIYRKIQRSHANFVLPLETRRRSSAPRPARDGSAAAGEANGERIGRLTRRVLERYVLPHVVVDGTGVVIHASARTAPFLQLSVGAPSNRLLELTPSELRPALRSVLSAMGERRRRVIRRGIEMGAEDGETVTLDVVADPLDSQETLIVFRETSRRPSDDDDMDADIGDFRTEERIAELEDELTETRSRLRTTVEDLETSNEELKSSNEEMMSMNEELQSANEELSTVNEELKNKLDELARLNADQVNFLEATRIATVFVDSDMKVRSFTPPARRLFGLGDRDAGRPLTDVRTALDGDVLRGAIDTALSGEAATRQIDIDGEVFTFRALPYLGHGGEIDGAVLVFDDVTELVRSQDAALSLEQDVAASRREIERLYESAPIGMALVDRTKRYRRINPSLAAYNGIPVSEHMGRTITEMLPEIGPKLDSVIDQVIETGEGVTRWDLEADDPKNPENREIFELDVYPLADENGKVGQVGIIVHRVTEARRLERDLRHLMAELQHRVKNSLATVVSIVRQSARNAGDPPALAEALTGRISALAATHSLLTASDWAAIPFARIVRQELAPYDDGDRIETSGTPIGVGPKAAVTLTLTLHELATNAAKYGALHGDDGRLKVEWRSDGDRFVMRWIERPAHPVEAPSRLGFGIRFIERILKHDLGGAASLEWDAEGLTCTITAPLERIVPKVDHVG